MDSHAAVRTAMERLLAAGPADARSAWSDVAGARLHHLESGTGRPIVLLHGGTGGGANWFRLIGPLANRHRVLAPDLPGFGLSDHRAARAPLGWTGARLLAEWFVANDVTDATVVGTSFGGLAALRLAQLAPGRVRALALIDSAGLGRGVHPALRVGSLPILSRVASRPGRRGTRILLHRLLTSDISRLRDDQVDRLVDFLYASAVRAGTTWLARTFRLFVGPAGQREVLSDAELTAIAPAVSILWGARDRLLPVRHARRAAAVLPDATVRILPHVGHSPNWEAPSTVVEMIERLERLA